MASDACNINPYHCAAIHPSATYLTEFYEALDAAERLETDSFGRSVAFYAAVSETTACLEFLISKNFNLTMHDKYKMTPLIQAARFGRSLNVELLIKFQTGNSNSSESSPAVFQSLLRNRRTAMHYAAYFGHADTCKILIKYGASVEPIENLDKQTPLHFAAKNGYLECVRVLIEEGGANPEKGDKFAKNALHLACIYGHLDIVHYLLSIGVDADSSDSSQNSPAHYAAAYGYIKILHLLIAYGSANPATTNVWRSTPCSVANMKGHLGIVKYLLQLPGNPIDVNFKDPEGMIMLQHAISEPVSAGNEMETNLKKTELLLSMDADVNSIDIHGKKANTVFSIVKVLISCLFRRMYSNAYIGQERQVCLFDSKRLGFFLSFQDV
jgi:ankyrin repeat protein